MLYIFVNPGTSKMVIPCVRYIRSSDKLFRFGDFFSEKIIVGPQEYYLDNRVEVNKQLFETFVKCNTLISECWHLYVLGDDGMFLYRQRRPLRTLSKITAPHLALYSILESAKNMPSFLKFQV